MVDSLTRIIPFDSRGIEPAAAGNRPVRMDVCAHLVADFLVPSCRRRRLGDQRFMECRDQRASRYLNAIDSGGTTGMRFRREAGDDAEKRKIAGLVAISLDWCWADFLKLRDQDLFGWSVGALEAWVTSDDGAPTILAKREKDERP